MRVVFRTDASLEISSGHVMRCLSLARKMKKDASFDIQFVCRNFEGNLNDLISKSGLKVIELLNPYQKNVHENKLLDKVTFISSPPDISYIRFSLSASSTIILYSNTESSLK